MRSEGIKPAVTRSDTKIVSDFSGMRLVKWFVRNEWPTCRAAATETHTSATTSKKI